MKKLLYCHLAVLLLPLAALAGAATDFDFFFHVQLWPASHCSGAESADCCYVPVNDKPPADFTIDGFRPNYASCRHRRDFLTPAPLCWPESCNVTDSLHASLIRDLNRGLLNNWPSLSCENRNPMDFWSEEWNEHGTCSNMDQHSYFRAALDFKARFNLTRILLNAGIVPSNENMYELSRIRDAVTEATGSAPNVECNQNEEGELQLYLVHQCVGLDGRSPVHCPRQLETTCTDEIKFPEFQINDDYYG